MYETNLKYFEEALKMKMVLDANDELKSANDNINWTLTYRKKSIEESKQIKTTIFEYFQDIANEYNFQFELDLPEGKYQSTKWYYNNIRIFPINGIIKPFKTKTRSKRNPISPALRHEALVRDGYRCLECGASNKETSLEVDHIISVAQGGTDELHNLQTLCITCNRAKDNRTWKAGKT